MERNSTSLFIDLFGITTVIPWIDNAPDFSGFADPTLSVLRQVWQAFIESGLELEIIPDPEPPVNLPTLQWVEFNTYISFDSNMINYEAVANSRHPSIVGKKDLTYSMILEHGIDNFALIFPAFCQIAEVSQEHRNQWADMAESFNLPTDFVAVIRGN